MFKWIFLVVGLVGGFLGGNYWAVHNPESASKLSAQEEQQVLEQTQSLKNKLDQLINKQKSGGINIPGVSNAFGGGGAVDPDLAEADQKAQQQIDMLKAKMSKGH